MRWKSHVRFGGRAEETDWVKGQHRASVRSDHTAVSLWVAAGASDLEVAKWAGHSSAAFTKSRYAHLFPEHGEALADRLEAFIAASTPTPAASVVHIHRS